MNVSVIIPTFNHAEFVVEAIDSVASSISIKPEIIVVNDGSTDNTKELIYRDRRIRYFEQSNQGAHSALNFGIAQASYEVIAILNDDDIYKSEHLVRAVLQMRTCGTDFVIGRAEPFGEGPLLKSVTNHMFICDQRIRDFGIIKTLTELNFAISTSSMVFRKEVFTQGEGFLKLSYCHDFEFLLRSVLKYGTSLYFSEVPTWKYRVHRTNSSSRIKKLSGLAEVYFALFSNLVWAPDELRRHVEIFRFLPGMNTKKMLEIQKIVNSPNQKVDLNRCLSKIEEYILENRMLSLQ
jgi:O-antigen biosynthesis protein